MAIHGPLRELALPDVIQPAHAHPQRHADTPFLPVYLREMEKGGATRIPRHLLLPAPDPLRLDL